MTVSSRLSRFETVLTLRLSQKSHALTALQTSVEGCPAAEPVALMRALVVVVAHELSERPLQRRATGEVSAPEGDAPVLLQDRALQALDEAVGPGMTRLRAGVAQAELPTGLIEGSVELGAPVGQDAPQGPARPAKERPEDVAQERGGIGT